MITPIEIQSKNFKSGIGYDKKDVDSFMKELLKNYETLYKENVELNDKINVLNEGISYYKTIEKTIQKALVLAETTAEEAKEAARQQAKAIEDEAKTKAKLILVDAKSELDQIHLKTINLLRQYELYRTQFKELAATQIELMNSDAFNIKIANLDVFMSEESNQDENRIKGTEYSALDETKEVESSNNEANELEEQIVADDFDFLNIDDLK